MYPVITCNLRKIVVLVLNYVYLHWKCAPVVTPKWFQLLCAVTAHRRVCLYLHVLVYVNKWADQSIRETGECFFLSLHVVPSLIRTNSVNQAWIPNTITCKVLCLGVIGLARTVFLKQLASLASPRQQLYRSPVQELQLARAGWRDETRERMKDRKEGKNRRRKIESRAWIIGVLL